jgi:oligopeptide transport system substrate-binding protein
MRSPAPLASPVAGPFLAALLCLWGLLAGCSKRETSSNSPEAQVLRLSQRNEPADLDPALVTLPDEFAVLRALLEGLLIPGKEPGADPRPGVAERFDVSPDGLVYTFHLRRNATWSTGDPVTAADFTASYRRLLTPGTAAPKAAVFFPVRNARAFVSGALTDFAAVGIQALDTHTLRLTLEQPNPRFPHYVASGPWLPIHSAIVAQHGRKWTTPEHFVGNGPFTLAEWRPHQRIVLRRNPRWHGHAGVRLSEIHLLHFDNQDAEERAYRAGQIDVTMTIPSTKVETYERERPTEVHRLAMIETRYLTFNTRRAPLNDPRVRRALLQAIDREALVRRVLRGNPPRADSFLPPNLPLDAASSSVSSQELPFDPDAARRQLADAGFPNGAGFPRLELSTWTQVAVLEAIQQMWRQELGLEVTIAQREAKVHLAALASGAYDIGFITEIPDVADATLVLSGFGTGSADNYPQWSDAAYDARLVTLGGTRDAAARAGLQREAGQHLLTAAPVAPLYYNLKLWLMSPRVRGWHEDGLWTRCYQDISLDAK